MMSTSGRAAGRQSRVRKHTGIWKYLIAINRQTGEMTFILYPIPMSELTKPYCGLLSSEHNARDCFLPRQVSLSAMADFVPEQ